MVFWMVVSRWSPGILVVAVVVVTFHRLGIVAGVKS